MANGIKIANFDVDVIKVGNANVDAVYVGSTKVYPNSYKLVAQYSNGTEYKVVCNSSTALTASEVSAHTTPMSAMTSAVVGSCVRKIDYNAFNGATSMSSITIDDAVTTLGNQAFYGCAGLTSFNFPSGLTTIEGACFRFANRITNLNVPNGVTTLGSGCFADMSGLTAATIPSSVTSVASNLFLRDTALKEVHFQSTTAPTLGADAFKNCTSLEKIYIPTCDSYDSYAANSSFSAYTQLIYAEDNTSCYKPVRNFKLKRYFINNVNDEIACDSTSAITSADVRKNKEMSVLSSSTSGLSVVEIGDCVSAVSANSFNYMTKLSAITLSDSVKTLGNYAFDVVSDGSISNNRIHDLDLGHGVTTIGNYAFRYIGYAYATNRPQITIPKNVTSIGEGAFTKGRMNKLIFENGGNLTVSSSSFSECSSYSTSSITIATNSIRSIGLSAFYHFSGLTTVSLSGVTSLQSNGQQFGGCNDLTDFTLYGNGSLTIPKYFVGGSSLTSITLSGISSISNSYGLNEGKTSGTRVLTMLDTTPPSIGSTSISNYNPTVIYVPSSAVNTYKTASSWSNYSTKIQAIPNS